MNALEFNILLEKVINSPSKDAEGKGLKRVRWEHSEKAEEAAILIPLEVIEKFEYEPFMPKLSEKMFAFMEILDGMPLFRLEKETLKDIKGIIFRGIKEYASEKDLIVFRRDERYFGK